MSVALAEQLALDAGPEPVELLTSRGAVTRRLRATIAPESVILDHQHRAVDHDDYVRLIVDAIMRFRPA